MEVDSESSYSVIACQKQSRITEEQLSAQDPSNIPEDWKTPGKYHPVCVAIWKAWLNFVPVFSINKQTLLHQSNSI